MKKVKLVSKDGSIIASLSIEWSQLKTVPQAIVRKTDELGVIYHLTQRDDPDGAQVYTRLDTVLVLDK